MNLLKAVAAGMHPNDAIGVVSESEAEHRYAALARGSSDGVIIHDGVRIVFANAVASHLADANGCADPVGMRIDSFVRDEDSSMLEAVGLALAADPTSEQRVTLHLRRLNGDVLPMEASVACVFWNGRRCYQVVLHDLRPQRELRNGQMRHDLVALLDEASSGQAAAGLGTIERLAGEPFSAGAGERRRLDDARLDTGRWPDVATFAAELTVALRTGALVPHYQAIVDLSSRRVRKVEALARWEHPQRGMIMPDEFITLAERCGLIVELGELILRRSCADIVKMNASGIDIGVSVNLSAQQLLRPDVADRVAGVLADTGLEPSRLWIEVTEGILVGDEALLRLHELRDLGAHLVIDDFGTGFATFQYLTRLPVDALKIDTSFVAGLGTNSSDTAIVRSVMNLGRELGLEVVAEGVENESQRAQLRALHCRLGQGWLFGPALPYDVFVATHRRNGAGEQPTPSWDAHESLRLTALRACRILDTSPEPAFDSLVQLSSDILSAPMTLISLVDADRQWFKASVGIDITETSREVSFCDYALLEPYQPLVIADTSLDPRFVDNELVTGSPHIRSYAGMPIRSREGLPLGALCIMDTVPRSFTDAQLNHLRMLSEQAAALLDLRRRTAELSDINQRYSNAARPPFAEDAAAEGSSSDAVGPAAGASRLLVELARMQQRRGAPHESGVIRVGGLEIDLDVRRLTVDHVQVETTEKEFDLLAFVASRAGHTFSVTELLQNVWSLTPIWQNPSVVTEHVYRLRAKIEVDPASPQLLRTIRGVGYCFGEPKDEAELRAPRKGTWTQVDGRFVEVGGELATILSGNRVDDVLGHDVFDFVALSSHPSVKARFEMRAKGQAPGPQVVVMRAVDGTEVVVLLSTENGKYKGRNAVFGTMREIPDPPQLIRQLSAGLVGETTDAVIVTDPELHVLSWNPVAQQLYGWSEREVLGHTFDSVVRWSSGPPDLFKAWRAVRVTGQWNYEAHQYARDGSIVTVRGAVNVVRDDNGDISGIVIVNRPVDMHHHESSNAQATDVDGPQIERGLHRSEFVVYYEPIVMLSTRRTVAVEARIRWLRPDGGTLESQYFLDAAERAGVLTDLAQFVCQTACLQLERWRGTGIDVALAIDVHARYLADQRFVDVLTTCADRLGGNGAELWLDVAAPDLAPSGLGGGERSDHEERIFAGLHAVALAGVRISVSDLEIPVDTGSPDPMYLHAVPIGALKIHAHLVGRLDDDVRNADFVRPFLEIGAALQVPVAADGVTTERQHDALVRLGCDVGQGPLYGEPALGDHLLFRHGTEVRIAKIAFD